jgi:calpain-15
MKNQKHIGFGKKDYVWKRLTELYKPNEINLLKEPPSIKEFPDILCGDVVQGEIGDCYFLSVLSSFAENPKRIKNFFPSIAMSPNGIFEAKVFIHGEPIKVVVDDYFPCIEKEDGSFAVAFTGINESTRNVWAMILEKVWAKVNFAYENIIAGVPSDAFEFLSPSPIDDYFHDIHHDEIYQRIIEADTKNFIITCAITASENQNLKELAKMGLIPNHAYSVLKSL